MIEIISGRIKAPVPEELFSEGAAVVSKAVAYFR
jgi:hypothetical protein